MKTTPFVNHLMAACLLVGLSACVNNNKKETVMQTFEKGTFGYDVNYLSQKDSLIILSGENGKAQVLVSPKYQAKVFTSTAEGLAGASLGYLNYKALDSKEVDEHMNGYGGENRLWLGPEGGQYSIYFKPDAQQIYENWHTPAPFDTEAWNIVSASAVHVLLTKEMQVKNYLGTLFNVAIDRKITLLNSSDIETQLGVIVDPSVQSVAYSTENVITNRNHFEWTAQTGAVCIWILDMFNTAPNAYTIIPFQKGEESKLGKIATSDYFGEIPADRLKIEENVLFLKTDGKCRNKLGLNAMRTTSVAGNYDPDAQKLTIVSFNVDKEATYLNQEWKPEKNPLIGDAINAYNDGPLEDGSIMGPFLELESTSPAAFLKPEESMKHVHAVFHFVGEEKELSAITEKVLGVSIERVAYPF